MIMTCNEFEELLPDYLQDPTDPRFRATVEKHMADCAECRESYALWSKLVTLPDVEPSPSMRARFDAMLNAYEEGRWEHDKLKEQRRVAAPSGFFDWFRMPAMQFGLAAAMLFVGILVGRSMMAPKAEPNAEAEQIAAMRQELSTTKQLVVLSMLQQQSASSRLQGVSYSMDVKQADPEIVSALLHTLRYDTSVDVRLAALDSLRRYNDEPKVRKGIVDALQSKQSPMVQIALIDTLVDMHERDAVDQIKKFQETPDLNPTVKQRAEWGINKLTRG
jgi:anti-sigma factor RsiW